MQQKGNSIFSERTQNECGKNAEKNTPNRVENWIKTLSSDFILYSILKRGKEIKTHKNTFTLYRWWDSVWHFESYENEWERDWDKQQQLKLHWNIRKQKRNKSFRQSNSSVGNIRMKYKSN